ncbi:MAG: HNH endonuclease [Deltaproteobacteria bacterium]|nr:HNH endonuclease [Deltaproteobacteria bacterium]
MNPYPKRKRIVDENEKQYVRDRDRTCLAGFFLKETCSEGVDVHHIHSRGSGGDDVRENMICLCRNHHNRAHTGQITRSQLEGWLTKLYKYYYG